MPIGGSSLISLLGILSGPGTEFFVVWKMLFKHFTFVYIVCLGVTKQTSVHLFLSLDNLLTFSLSISYFNTNVNINFNHSLNNLCTIKIYKT